MSVEDLPFIEDALDWWERCTDEEVDLFVVVVEAMFDGMNALCYRVSSKEVIF